MTPNCCKKCNRFKREKSCCGYHRCAEWRKWFRREWAIIQKAAENIKKSTKEAPRG